MDYLLNRVSTPNFTFRERRKLRARLDRESSERRERRSQASFGETSPSNFLRARATRRRAATFALKISLSARLLALFSHAAFRSFRDLSAARMSFPPEKAFTEILRSSCNVESVAYTGRKLAELFDSPSILQDSHPARERFRGHLPASAPCLTAALRRCGAGVGVLTLDVS